MESETQETNIKKREQKKPKHIIVAAFSIITGFTRNLSKCGEFEFEAKICGSFLKFS